MSEKFPAVSKDDRSSVFRLSFYFKEKVDPKILQEAVNQVLPRFEAFAVELKSGLFWYYLAANRKPFYVEEEPTTICKYFSWHSNQGYLFKIYYFSNKITLETFHSLSDGTGAMEFLKSIAYTYFELQGYKLEHEGKIVSQKPHSVSENLDMFEHEYDSTNKKSLKEEPAYHIEGERFESNYSLCVRAQVPTLELINLARKHNSTVGQYITALLAYSIYSCSLSCRTSSKPIKMFIPVNLRKFFKTSTLRNFSLYIKTTYHGSETWDFERMLKVTKEQFEEQLNKEDLHRRINANVGIEKNPLVRMLPLFIKNMAFRIGYYYLAENISTCYISNLGNISLPSTLENFIEDVEFSIGGTSMAVASVKGHTNLMLNTQYKDLSFIQLFVQSLVDSGLDVTIDTNYREGLDDIL
ncbi:MAG TPA: hypothetical protein VHQ24_10135 [Lachnospiraceae bacterium]|nr:hypothetical protein [Lachnospiraceae bacterium]